MFIINYLFNSKQPIRCRIYANAWPFIFILLIAFTSDVFGQKDFRSGYVILLNGDTLSGEIDYRGDLLMDSICRFRNTGNNVENEYLPGDIRAYRFAGDKYFVSRKIRDNKPVFLEFLIHGDLDVFYNRDESGDHFYIEKEGMELVELPYVEKIVYVNEKPFKYQSKEHIHILEHYLDDVPGFTERIESMKKLNEESLVRLASEYNAISGDKTGYIVYEKKKPFISLAAEPVFGTTWYRVNKSFYMTGGAYIYTWLPRLNEKLYFKTGILYHELEGVIGLYSAIRYPVQIQYLYPSGMFRPKANLGITYTVFRHGEIIYRLNTIHMGGGVVSQFTDKLGMSVNIDTEFTSLTDVFVNEDLGFGLITISLNLGIYANF